MNAIAKQTQFTLRKKPFYKSREFILLIILIAVNVLNAQLSPFYLNANGLLSATKVFLDKGFLVLGLAFVLMIGEIDISVASTIALTSCVMGVAYGAGAPMPAAMLLCLGVGALCGLVNGVIVAKFRELASMIVTLATMSLYRGIAWILLGDQGAGGYPDWFPYLGDGALFQIGEIQIPFLLAAFAGAAALFGFILHKTVFGKHLYMIGSNANTAFYAGVKVSKIRVAVFTVCGLMAGVTSLFLTSRIMSSKPNIATGYELEAIAIVILGGIKTDGGTGNIPGVVIAAFIVGYIRYGLGLKSIPSEVVLIVVGALLIVSILIPNIMGSLKAAAAKKKTAAQTKA